MQPAHDMRFPHADIEIEVVAAVALGGNTVANANNGVALGTLARATAAETTAVGVGAAATGQNSSALGRGAAASALRSDVDQGPRQLSIGS